MTQKNLLIIVSIMACILIPVGFIFGRLYAKTTAVKAQGEQPKTVVNATLQPTNSTNNLQLQNKNTKTEKNLQLENRLLSIANGEKKDNAVALSNIKPSQSLMTGKLTEAEFAIVVNGLDNWSKLTIYEKRNCLKFFAKGLHPVDSRAMLLWSWLDAYRMACEGSCHIKGDINPGLFIKDIEPYLCQNYTVAEVGCGGCRNIPRFSNMVGNNGKVFATDIDKNVGYFIELLKKSNINEKSVMDNVIFVQNRFDNISTEIESNQKMIADGSVDTIIMENVHMIDAFSKNVFSGKEKKDAEEFIISLYSALKPGGVVIIIEGHRIEQFPAKTNFVAELVRNEMQKRGFKEILLKNC